MSRRVAVRSLVVLVVAVAIAQAVPYGHGHANPPARSEPRWPDATTRMLVAHACGDCHSYRTSWPWYSNVAPVSWLVTHDVQEGRGRLNFSEWKTRAQPSLDEVAGAVRGGEMPPLQYRLVHRDAGLSAAERRRLVAGLTALYAADPPAQAAGRGG